jgi:hypothetical protein
MVVNVTIYSTPLTYCELDGWISSKGIKFRNRVRVELQHNLGESSDFVLKRK